MWNIFRETIDILNESAIYLLLGFGLAGVLHVLLRRTPGFAGLLASKGGRSVVLAALFGAPLPLCSCGVVPAGLTLRKSGASKGATVSFLISAPETDITSILLTYGLLGPVMAIFRPLAAVATAIAAGLVTNVVERWTPSEPASSGICGSGDCCGEEEAEYNSSKGPIWNALHYGFVRFFDDVIGSLLLGVLLGGVITALLPRLGVSQLSGGSFITMLFMLVIGIPMYVCATASTPIAAGLIVGGVSPGAALVFLLAGPATNIGSLLVLRKYLGRSILAAYLGSIAVVSVVMGLCLDAAFDRTSIQPAVLTNAAEGPAGPAQIAGTVVLLILACMSFARGRVFARIARRVSGRRRNGRSG
jgi:uncharacterized protein